MRLQYENSRLVAEVQTLKEACRQRPSKVSTSTQTTNKEELKKNKSIQELFQQLKSDNEGMAAELRRLEEVVSSLRAKVRKQKSMLAQKDGVIEGLQKVIEGAMQAATSSNRSLPETPPEQQEQLVSRDTNRQQYSNSGSRAPSGRRPPAVADSRRESQPTRRPDLELLKSEPQIHQQPMQIINNESQDENTLFASQSSIAAPLDHG